MDGIATLANDKVFDQLVALLNSIEVNAGKEMPVCIYPYDDNLSRVVEEVSRRPQVQLFSDRDAIDRWEAFSKQAWDAHPTARQRWNLGDESVYYRLGMHRRFCALDGPFERFIYMDADTLLLDDPTYLFDRLSSYDCVVYDFQYKEVDHVYEASSPKLWDVFSRDRVESEIFCAGFFGARRSLFDDELRQWLIEQLRAGEGELLYPMAPDQTLINYMMMRSNKSIYNFALDLPPEQRVGCCVTSPHFEAIDHLLYDNGKRISFLHYIGIASEIFNTVCAGENVDFPYRDTFLHYRYLHEPEKTPKFVGRPRYYKEKASLKETMTHKLAQLFAVGSNAR